MNHKTYSIFFAKTKVLVCNLKPTFNPSDNDLI